MDIDLGRSTGDATDGDASSDDGDDAGRGRGRGLRDRILGGSSESTGSESTASSGGPARTTRSGPASTPESDAASGADRGPGPLDGVTDRLGRLRRRVDPRETAETAARGLVRLSLRIVGAVLIAYAAWLFVAVDGWTRLAAAAAAVGFLPAFAPGFVVGLAGLVWKLFSIA